MNHFAIRPLVAALAISFAAVEAVSAPRRPGLSSSRQIGRKTVCASTRAPWKPRRKRCGVSCADAMKGTEQA